MRRRNWVYIVCISGTEIWSKKGEFQYFKALLTFFLLIVIRPFLLDVPTDFLCAV